MSETNNKTETEIMDEKNFRITMNHKYFTMALFDILDIVEKKSNENDLDGLDRSVKKNIKIIKNHTRLRSMCENIRSGFSSNENFDDGQFIKKVYKSLTLKINMLYPDPSVELFRFKNEKKEIVTIIPSIDVGLIINDLSEDESTLFWNYMYIMYISSVDMISAINENRTMKNTDVVEQIRNVVSKMEIVTTGKYFNPYIE